MIERTSAGDIDHGAIRKGDFRRAKRLKVNQMQKMLESKDISAPISHIVHKNRMLIPESLKTKGNKLSAKVKEHGTIPKEPLYTTHQTRYRPGFYQHYYVYVNGELLKKRWESTKEDFYFYDWHKCHRTEAEALQEPIRIGKEEKIYENLEELIKAMKKK